MTQYKHAVAPPPHKLAQHTRELAKAFKVTLLELPMPLEYSIAVPTERVRRPGLVAVSLIDSERAYAVALHEMGHCLSPNGMLRGRGGQLANTLRIQILEEEAAWEWAEYYACCWTSEMIAAKKFGMDTYAESLRQEEERRLRAIRRSMEVQQTVDSFLKGIFKK